MLFRATNSVDSSDSQQHPKASGAKTQALDWDNLQDVLHRRIAYSPVFAAIGGNVQAGVFLSQAYYWAPKTNDPEGWFYKTKEDWFNETQLTRRQLDTVIRHLVEKGLISIKYGGIPRRLFYRLNKEAVVDAIARYLELDVEAQNPETTQYQQSHNSATQAAQLSLTSYTIATNKPHESAQQAAQVSQTSYTNPPTKSHNFAKTSGTQSQPQQEFQAGAYIKQEKKQEITQTQDSAQPPHPSVCVNNCPLKTENAGQPEGSLPNQTSFVQNYSKPDNLNQNSSVYNKSNHQGKNSSLNSPKPNKRIKNNTDVPRIVWECPQPELENEFYEWRGQLMVESGFVTTPATKVLAAKAWVRNHPEDATELFNLEFLPKHSAKLSEKEREEALLEKLRKDHENRINRITADGTPAKGVPAHILERISKVTGKQF